ncbi:MAG: hypothetical protein ACRDRZ_04455 [Pseudonocardiaceae bacterium]
MVVGDPQRDGPGSEADERRRLDDELVGLDRDDPEVQAFAEHLARTRRARPAYTVEGYLSGISDFAESANRAGGGRRLAALVVVGLLLLGAAYVVWNALGVVLTTFLITTIPG